MLAMNHRCDDVSNRLGADARRGNPMKERLRAVIASHRAAAKRLGQLGDDVDNDTLDAAVAAESSAMRELAWTPCANDEDFVLKLSYILAYKIRTEKAPLEGDGFGALAVAVAARISERAA